MTKADLSLAADLGPPPELLAQLSHHDALAVRELVAANPATPRHTLARLARDEAEYVYVVTKVAENVSTSPDSLHFLASDIWAPTRLGVARNPSTLPQTLHLLSADHDDEVRLAVLTNPRTPPASRRASFFALLAEGGAYLLEGLSWPDPCPGITEDEWYLAISLADGCVQPPKNLEAVVMVVLAEHSSQKS